MYIIQRDGEPVRYCSKPCAERAGEDGEAEYIPDRPTLTNDGAVAWLEQHGWGNHWCECCRGPLIR